nr:serine/arginine repetitive matrix protein 2-like [Manis javanica]
MTDMGEQSVFPESRAVHAPVRLRYSMSDCEQSEPRTGDQVCVRARGRGARGAAHSRAPGPARRTTRRRRRRRRRRCRRQRWRWRWKRRRRRTRWWRRRRKKKRRRRRKWLSAAGGIKSNQTRPENWVQEGSDRRRMGKGEPLTAFETSQDSPASGGSLLSPGAAAEDARRTVSGCRTLSPRGRSEPASRKVLLKSGSFL